MIITFSKASRIFDVGQIVEATLAAKYNRNVYVSVTWAKGRRVRFTLETRDARANGSRTSASGRHMRKASWEAHWDAIEALLTADRDATVLTALVTYRGRADFYTKAPATAFKNVGSIAHPRLITDCTVQT